MTIKSGLADVPVVVEELKPGDQFRLNEFPQSLEVTLRIEARNETKISFTAGDESYQSNQIVNHHYGGVYLIRGGRKRILKNIRIVNPVDKN